MFKDRLKRGLYDYREEHDACGIGFYANMDNLRSHDIIEKSLEMLRRLDHRGGIGADGITGDLSLIHISEPTRRLRGSRMPSSA